MRDAEVKASSSNTMKKSPSSGLLEALPTGRELSVVFDSVSCFVKKSAEPPSAAQRMRRAGRAVGQKLRAKRQPDEKEEMRQILFNITGSVHPGEVLALMGPSGSGKTTLLSILGGRTPAGARQLGAVLFNGGALDKRTKRQVGYVMQDDLLYETLTVYETLYYAAMLRLPSHMTRHQKIARVNAVIGALGLSRCRDTIIGGFFRRGVSGGERKRVSVGHELLINPSLLLLDEPTSGLDATTAMHLLRMLGQLAAGGRAVVTTIHQPSSRLYQQLDTVLLLSQGRPLYYGGAAAAAQWCASLGHAVPFGVNLADWLLDLASGEVAAPGTKDADAEEQKEGAVAAGEAERLRLVATSEGFLRRHPQGFREGMAVSREERGSGDSDSPLSSSYTFTDDSNGDVVVDVNGGRGGAATLLAGKLGAPLPEVVVDVELGLGAAPAPAGESPPAQERQERRLLRSQTSKAAARPGASRWGASYAMQLRVLFVRAVRVRRFETMATQDIVQFTIVGLVSGMIWWQVGKGDTLRSAEDTQGLLFFEALFLGFRSMFTALFTFPQERKMMLKERASGMYRLSAFYLARTASDVPMDFTIPSILVILVYLMCGLRPGGWFFANFFTCLLSTMVAQSFGLLVGATVMQAKTAQTVAAVIMLTSMLLGGFYVKNIPFWVSWLKWLSFLTYSFNLLTKIQFGGRVVYDCEGIVAAAGAKLVPSTDCPSVQNLQSAMQLFVDPHGAPWEAAVLVGFLVVFRLLVYVALRIKTAPGGPAGRR